MEKDTDSRHFETLTLLRLAWSIHSLLAGLKVIFTIKHIQWDQKTLILKAYYNLEYSHMTRRAILPLK